MSRSSTCTLALGLLAACAPADPGWSTEHPANSASPAGAEAPVAAVLREEPAAPPASDGHDHHGAESESSSEHAEDHDAM